MKRIFFFCLLIHINAFAQSGYDIELKKIYCDWNNPKEYTDSVETVIRDNNGNIIPPSDDFYYEYHISTDNLQGTVNEDLIGGVGEYKSMEDNDQNFIQTWYVIVRDQSNQTTLGTSNTVVFQMEEEPAYAKRIIFQPLKSDGSPEEGVHAEHWMYVVDLWNPVFHQYFTINHEEVLRSSPFFLPSNYDKFNHWNNDRSDNLNHNYFNYDNVLDEDLTAQYNNCKGGITIQNNIEGFTGDSIEFKDPWLVDLDDPQGIRNQGLNAPFKKLASPFNPSLSSDYKGVFLNQGSPNWTPPYYSISIPSNVYISQTGKYHDIYLINWVADPPSDADFKYPNSSPSGVVFKNDGVTITANLKAQGLSNEQNAYRNSSQRKMIQALSGSLIKVYESMGNIWGEVSENQLNSAWILMNDGHTLSSNLAKSPSLDYSYYTYGTSVPLHQLLVVFQEKAGNNSNIKILYFERMDQYNNPLDFWQLKDSKSFFAVYNNYDNIDCAPVIAFNHPAETFTIVYKCTDGLYYRNGSVTAYGLPPGPGGISLGSSSTKINGTSSNSFTPSIATTKNGINYTPLVWGENNTVKYISIIEANPIIEDISTGDGFSKRNNPSIVVMDDHSAKVVWKAERRYYPDGGISPFRQTAVIFKDPGVEGFNQFGSNVGNPNINRADEGSFFAFAWSENDGATNKFTDNNLSSYWTMPNNTGKDVQISNGPNKFSMYAESFNSSFVPHYFKTSPNLASMQYETPVIHGIDGPAVGREGTISAGHAQFFFNFGDINVDSGIGFIPLTQHPSYDSVEVLNEYSLTEAFNIYDGIDFMYTILYGTTDSTGAAALLVDGNYVSYCLYLVDDATGEVIAPLDNVVFEEGNIFQYANIRYQLETTGLGNRRVRMKLVAANNFEAEYSLNASYTDGSESLGKALIKKKKAIVPVTEYAITQNFPNPFNPATTINYQIPQTGFVTLKIYDILGKEVATLVNEQKTQGRYSVNFDASRLASGVYIYQLRVNDYVSSKKMLLLK